MNTNTWSGALENAQRGVLGPSEGQVMVIVDVVEEPMVKPQDSAIYRFANISIKR